jgi:hypothetical protein
MYFIQNKELMAIIFSLKNLNPILIQIPHIPVLVEKIQCNPDLIIIYKIQKNAHSKEK